MIKLLNSAPVKPNQAEQIGPNGWGTYSLAPDTFAQA